MLHMNPHATCVLDNRTVGNMVYVYIYIRSRFLIFFYLFTINKVITVFNATKVLEKN